MLPSSRGLFGSLSDRERRRSDFAQARLRVCFAYLIRQTLSPKFAKALPKHTSTFTKVEDLIIPKGEKFMAPSLYAGVLR